MDQSETSTEMIKASMSQTPVAKRNQRKRLIQRISVKLIWLQWLLLGRRRIFPPVFQVWLMPYQAMLMGRRNDQVWIGPQTGHAETVRSLTMSSRYLWKNCSALFPIIDPTSKNRQGKIKGLNTEQVSIMFPQEDLQPLTKSWRVAKIRQNR